LLPFVYLSSAPADCPPALPLRTPSKRRGRPPKIHEEEGDPSIASTRQLRSRTIGPQQENDPGVKGGTVRSKRTVRDDRTVSPSEKINSHFRESKSVTGASFSVLSSRRP